MENNGYETDINDFDDAELIDCAICKCFMDINEVSDWITDDFWELVHLDCLNESKKPNWWNLW